MLVTANIIKAQIGVQNLMCYGSRKFIGGESDGKTHDGFLEFTVSNNPKIRTAAQVRIELAFNDTYTVKVFDNKKEHLNLEEVYCDQLSEILFDILG